MTVFLPRALTLLAVASVIAACGTSTTSPSASSAPSPSPDASVEFSLPPLPSGPDALGLEPFASGFQAPIGIAHPPDGTGRLAVVEAGGTIRWVAADGSVGEVPALDIRERVRVGEEQGLLGLAFHPAFATNGRLFVNYISAALAQSIIAEYRASTDRTTIDPGSERILLTVNQPAANHNGGDLAFGPDGYLYIGLGDGGGANDQFGNGQNLDSLLGKLLRIDVDSTPADGLAYAIPATNPFVGGIGGRAEIWAIGLRNPWQFSFDRDWGDLYIGDVGQDEWEEINRQPADDRGGANYGWPIFEGRHCFQAASCSTEGFVAPIAEYSHELGEAVIGGYVYRGTRQPGLVGVYVFGDLTGRLFTLQVDEGTEDPKVVRVTGWQITAFGEDESGEIYLVALNGTLSRIVVAD